MNWEHLRAFLWLHSRISANKSMRASSLSRVLQSILLTLAIIVSILAFGGALAVGFYGLRTGSPAYLMYAWAGLVGAFLFTWLLSLFMELQRSELLPIEKFMHYPISVSGLFLINYVAAILSERITVFGVIPAMLGLAVGLVLSRGADMLWLFPLLLAFILMVTAVTHQFRGWLAVLMMNKRHRRTVITVVTVGSMLLFQLPYLSSRAFGTRRNRAPSIASTEQLERTVRMVTMTVPVGWLPYGALASAEGRFLPPLLGIVGMTLIGAFSLRRSYRTTVRLYTGNYGSGKTRKVPWAASQPFQPTSVAGQTSAGRARSFLEIELPWVSEQTAATALTTLRSLTRAPEVKMVLLSPVIMMVFFGASVVKWSSNPAEFTRPLMASGVLLMIFFSTSSLVFNQFAFDRSGFRNYVLASAPRRDLLMGKNLAIAPVILGMSVIALSVLEWLFPMRIDHFIAVLVQMITMFLLFCMFSNFHSIISPVAISAGSLRPAGKPSGKMILFSMLTLMLFPLALAPSMIPLGLEYVAHWMGWYGGIPVYLLLSVLEAIGVGFVYLRVLDYQGRLFQSRELKILDVVAARVAEG